MTLVQEWIESSYARSTANDAGKIASDVELLAVANRIYQWIFALAATAAPDNFLARTTIALVGGAGALPSDVIDIDRVQSASGGKINVYKLRDLDRLWASAPAVFRQGASLVSRGGVGDPGPTDTLTVWVLDAPATLAALSTPIDARFPVRYHELVIVTLALYLSTKDEGRDAGEFQKFKSERDAQLNAFLHLAGLSLTALQTPHGGAILKRFDAVVSGA